MMHETRTRSVPSGLSDMNSTVLDVDSWRHTAQTPLMYRVGNSTIRMQKPLVAAILILIGGFVFFCIAVAMVGTHRSQNVDLEHDHLHNARTRVNTTYPLTKPVTTSFGATEFSIGIISDLDKDSKVDGESSKWRSYFKRGNLTWDGKRVISISWDEEETELTSSLSLGGRGMELSELIAFNGKLYTVDDRTGVVYQVVNGKVIPWVILQDGNGMETKGFKCEWATVKDNHMYVGGLGKEWTTSDGNILNHNPMFVKRISHLGEVEHLDWVREYKALRSAAGIELPGYMIHESAEWSDVHSRWFFLPRRASKEKYNDVDDEKRGTDMMLSATSDFRDIQLKHVGEKIPTHGFSSFKFIPGTKDQVIVALKSEEIEGRIASYITVFNLDGLVLYPETKIGEHKYEGIEFI